jgi:hypothetical protein
VDLADGETRALTLRLPPPRNASERALDRLAAGAWRDAVTAAIDARVAERGVAVLGRRGAILEVAVFGRGARRTMRGTAADVAASLHGTAPAGAGSGSPARASPRPAPLWPWIALAAGVVATGVAVTLVAVSSDGSSDKVIVPETVP